MSVTLNIIGTSIAKGNMALLERLTISPQDRPKLLPELKKRLDVSELVYLATCNRVEVTTICDTHITAATIRNRVLDFFLAGGRDFEFTPADLYQLSSGEAVRHLFRVASSLESLVVGETQITGQFKDAYQECSNLNLVGERLELAMQKALHTARHVRNETDIGNGSLSIASLVMNELEEKGDLSGITKVALVGSGEMSSKMGRYLQGWGVRNLLFVNRTLDKARQLASRFSAKAVALDEFTANPDAIDVIVSATSASLPIFNTTFLKRLQILKKKITCVDLAIPRDFADEFKTAEYITYIDILELQRRQKDNLRNRFMEMDKASNIIDQEVRDYQRAQFESDLRPVVRKSFEESLQYALNQCDVLFSSRLNGQSPDEVRVFKALIRRVVGFSSAQFSQAVAGYFSEQQEILKVTEKEQQLQNDSSQKENNKTSIGSFHA